MHVCHEVRPGQVQVSNADEEQESWEEAWTRNRLSVQSLWT